MKRKLLVKILCLATCLLCATGFAACGSKSTHEDNDSSENKEVTLQISTVEELQALSGSESSYELTADLDLSGQLWTPIVDFKGKLDGKNHKISNLTVEESNGTIGLFETLQGQVYNLTLDSVSVNAIGMTGDAGGLCGKADNAIIENVTVYGTVSAKLMDHIGGIAGYAVHTLINNCKNYADVEGFTRVGGIAGTYERQIASDDKYIENNENYGNINGLQNNDESHVGGVFGETYIRPGGYRTNSTNWNFTLQSFKNYGTVTSAGGRVGGIVGIHTTKRWSGGDTYVDLSWAGCTNEGAVKGTIYVGGIVGRLHYSKSVLTCENKGEVTGTELVGGIVGSVQAGQISYNKNSGKVTGTCYVGGIAGYSAYLVSDCENVGAITATGLSDNDGGIGWSGGAHLGGVVGATAQYVTNCKNSGEIISTGGGCYIGGVAGFMRPEYGDIIENENSGSISATGGQFIGGVAGFLYAYRPYKDDAHYTFTGKNAGNISAPDSMYIGGIVGYINCKSDWSYQDRCYAVIINSTNTGNIVGKERVAGIVGTAYIYMREDDIYWSTNSNTGSLEATDNVVQFYHIEY